MSADPRPAILRNFLQIYKEVLDQPAPADLIDLMTRLEEGVRSK